MRRSGRPISAAIRITFWWFPLEYARTFLVRIEIEPVDELVSIGDVGLSVDASEQGQSLGPGQGRPEIGFPGHESQPAMGLDGMTQAVKSENAAVPACRLTERKKKADSGRLACTVGSEVADHLTLCNLKIEVIERKRVAVPLGQTLGLYGCICRQLL